MSTILEQLTAHARELAQQTGGKLPVEMWARVILAPGGLHCGSYQAYIGRIGHELAYGCSNVHPEDAIAKALVEWRKKGSPSDPIKAEVEKMVKRAAELGYSLVSNPHYKLDSCANSSESAS